jgi:lipoprotein signal peptidase
MKRLLKSYDYGDGSTILQKISWLLKGILLGPIAVLLAYIFLKDEERELIKWAWFGCIGFAAILIGILISL